MVELSRGISNTHTTKAGVYQSSKDDGGALQTAKHRGLDEIAVQVKNSKAPSIFTCFNREIITVHI